MKAFTDIEQSKRLAEILPIESADMFYRNNGIDVKLMWEHNAHNVKYPCWSLAALLDQLEDVIVDENGYNYQLQIIKEGLQYYLVYEGVDDFASYETSVFDDLIDACVEMILKLKEKDLL